jgi:hypothetical protein
MYVYILAVERAHVGLQGVLEAGVEVLHEVVLHVCSEHHLREAGI